MERNPVGILVLREGRSGIERKRWDFGEKDRVLGVRIFRNRARKQNRG